MLNEKTFAAIVARAAEAPSVHNTQGARWRYETDGSILIMSDRARNLPIGDPHGKDAAISLGAAIEGTSLALSEHGLNLASVERPSAGIMTPKGIEPVARLVLRQGEEASPLAPLVTRRATWRGKFGAADGTTRRRLSVWAGERPDIALAADRGDLECVAELNISATLAAYRQPGYRAELMNWMRLTRSHPRYERDGLNLEALQLGRIEGLAAKTLLADPAYKLVSGFGAARHLFGERAETLSATGIVLIHRARDERFLEGGRIAYRRWLELTELGLSAWPMGAIADDADARDALAKRFSVPDDRRLVMALRVGPAKRALRKWRLPTDDLIVPSH